MTTDKPLLREIAALPNGPQKKFLIIKHYGADLRQATKTDIAKLGCETLLALLGGGLPFGEVGNPLTQSISQTPSTRLQASRRQSQPRDA